MRRTKGTGSTPRWREVEKRWECRFVDATGKKRSVYSAIPGRAGERACASKRDDGLKLALSGISPSKMALADYLDRFIARNPRRWGSDTVQRYGELSRTHVRPSDAGRIGVGRLQPEHLEDLYDSLRVSPKTVELLHCAVRAALTQAAERGHAVRNVAALVKPPRVPKFRPTDLTADQVRAVLASSEEAEDRLTALWTLGAQTGIREGELLALTWGDIDFGRGAIILRDPEKDGIPRPVRLAKRSLRLLRAHKARQNEERLRAAGAYEGLGLVFASLDGNHLDPRRVREAFYRALARAGVDRQPDPRKRPIRFHDLRHAVATFYLGQGVPLKVVSEILGHRDTKTTENLYQHVTQDMQAAAVAAMDEAFGA